MAKVTLDLSDELAAVICRAAERERREMTQHILYTLERLFLPEPAAAGGNGRADDAAPFRDAMFHLYNAAGQPRARAIARETWDQPHLRHQRCLRAPYPYVGGRREGRELPRG